MSRLNKSQIDQVCFGLENGLSMEQVSMYAKPELDSKQMRQELHDLVITAAE